jgi:haloacetate dehalogenase
VLVLWGAKGLVGRKYDVLSIWRERAIRASGKALPGGHWIPEECPNEMLAEIKPFLHSSA